MDGAPNGDGNDPDAAETLQLKLVSTLFGYNSFQIILRLYFHRVVIDLVHLVIGSVYLAKVPPDKDVRPLYLVVRGALGLLSMPISIASDFQVGPDVSERLTMRLVSLKITAAALFLVRFGWLIYGTVLVVTHVLTEGGCDKPCSWTVFASVIVDWTWAVLSICAGLCPLCWSLTDQWSTILFMILVAIRKGSKEKSETQTTVTK